MSSQPLPTLLDLEKLDKTEALSELWGLRKRILRTILVSAVILGGIMLFLVLYTTVTNRMYLLPVIYSLVYGFLLVITFRKNLPAKWQAIGLVSVFFILATTSLAGSGLRSSNGILIYVAFVVMSATLIGRRAAIIAQVTATLILVLNAIGTQAGWLPLKQLDLTSIPSPVANMVLVIVIFSAILIILSSSINVILNGLTQILVAQKQAADELTKERSNLEKRVDDRTYEIQKRAAQQQAASQVARAVSTQTDLENVLNIAITQIQNRFGYYHAGIFLVDDNREFAVLRAATSTGGRQMIANNHRLRIGEEGIVGYVTAKGEPRIAVDVGLDAVHFQNPFLPETRSEIALPLMTSKGVIGALDVQSREEAAFTREDLETLQTIADQLAAAMDHSRTLADYQQRIQELESSYRKLTQKTWQDFAQQTRRQLAFGMQRNDPQPEARQISVTPQIQSALQQGEIVIQKPAPDASQDPTTQVAVPVKLREQVIGVIHITFKAPSITQDTRDMLETAASRLAVALENVRLLDEVQTRAEREHQVSDLSSKIRSASEIDHILRTTAEELGRILGVPQVTVQLRKDQK